MQTSMLGWHPLAFAATLTSTLADQSKGERHDYARHFLSRLSVVCLRMCEHRFPFCCVLSRTKVPCWTWSFRTLHVHTCKGHLETVGKFHSGRRPAASTLPGVALHRRITADTAASGALVRSLSFGLWPQSEFPNNLLHYIRTRTR
jgi:hypothetical protein